VTRHLRRRNTVPALAAGLMLACLRPAVAAPTLLPDSTSVEQWTLANGLRVTTRHIPGATGVAVAIAFDGGSAADKAGQEGMSWLLAESWFTGAAGPAGEVPERTREELASQRPVGWQIKVLPRWTVFIEGTTPRQYPVVLHQAALRLRGVRVPDATLKEAVRRVHEDLRGTYAWHPDTMATQVPRVMAAGADSAALLRLAAGAGLDGVTTRDVERRLRERFVPVNAALSVAGDLRGIDLRPFLEREFGTIPAGTTPPRDSIVTRAASLTLRVPGISGVASAVGIRTPLVTDADHPEFFVSMLLMGSRALGQWGPQVPPLTSRFRFSLFDDPDLARFFPPTDPQQASPAGVSARLAELIDPIARSVMPAEGIDSAKRGVFWMLGGPMMPSLLRSARAQPGVVASLASTMAVRAVWQPEPFWATYRMRLAAVTELPLETWAGWALDPANQVRLVMADR
jgi:hypothetical protein